MKYMISKSKNLKDIVSYTIITDINQDLTDVFERELNFKLWHQKENELTYWVNSEKLQNDWGDNFIKFGIFDLNIKKEENNRTSQFCEFYLIKIKDESTNK